MRRGIFVIVLAVAVMGVAVVEAETAEETEAEKMIVLKNEVYGDLRLAVDYVDSDATFDGAISMNSNAPRFGARGSGGVVGGLTAFYKIEWGLDTLDDINGDNAGNDASLTNRFAFAGLRGAFGSVLYGKTSTPYKMAGLRLDPFYDTSAIGVRGGGYLAAGGASYGLSNLTNSWSNNTLAYATPNLNGFSANLAAYLEDGNSNDHDYVIGGQYASDMFTVGAFYLEHGAGTIANAEALFGGEGDAIRVFGRMSFGGFTMGVSFEQLSPQAGLDQDYLFVSGVYKLPNGTKILATYGDTKDTGVDGFAYTVGVSHMIVKNAALTLLWSSFSSDLADREDQDVLSLGFSYKFSFGTKNEL